jgi:Asparagine synthase
MERAAIGFKMGQSSDDSVRGRASPPYQETFRLLRFRSVDLRVAAHRLFFWPNSAIPYRQDIMYLFCSDSSALLENRLLRAGARMFGTVKVIQSSGSCLIWVDTSMSRLDRAEDKIRVELFLPGDNGESANTFDWDLETGTVRFERSWRGVFTTFFANRFPQVVTSHKKLASLFVKKPVSLKALPAGGAASLHLPKQARPLIEQSRGRPHWDGAAALSFDGIAAVVRKNVVQAVRANCRDGAALLLSGGIDSTVIAAVARDLGIRLRTFTFALRETLNPDVGLESDRSCASEVAALFGHEHRAVLLEAADLIRDIPAAAYLGETARSTIVDELPAHVAMARYFRTHRIRQVLTGEGADDLFGAFPFALRYYRGPKLRSFLQRELLFGLPDELAIVQNVYSFWGVALVHPYWNEELRAIGHWLPLAYRIDKQRLMKSVLRRAFADLVPEPLLSRAKGVPRDCTQIRQVLESSFGRSPNRYRPALSKMMERGSAWRERQLSTLQNS